MERKHEVSKAVVQRLPRYYRNLCELKEEGIQRISSSALAERMGLTASQIRQDFNCFGGFGQQGYGYNVDKLCDELIAILGLHDQRTAILLGVGNLGHALLNNFDFAASGFHLLAAFDTNPTVCGRTVGGHTVLDGADVYDFVQQNKPDIAVLTLPRNVAPHAAQQLVACGIGGLWNFTGEDLHLGGLGVPVENVHLSDSLMTLCHWVGQQRRDQAMGEPCRISPS